MMTTHHGFVLNLKHAHSESFIVSCKGCESVGIGVNVKAKEYLEVVRFLMKAI